MQRPSITCGIDLGGTSIRVGLFDAASQLIGSQTVPTRIADGPDSAVAEMAGVLRALLQTHSVESLRGIGIGSPGPINLRTGVLGVLPNLPGWENYPLRDALAEATDMPVFLESDANAAAIAEWKLGAGREAGLNSLAMITLGTGVGSGLILNGCVWHGMFGMGGEVGHAVIEPNGEMCGCGSRGCLEMYTSAGALCRFAQRIAGSTGTAHALQATVAQPGGFTPRDIAMLAETGDAGAKQAFMELGRHLGLGVANLISTLDLPLVVIGGGLASSWRLFAPAMFEAIQENSVVYRLVKPSQFEKMEPDHSLIVPASLGPSAGLLGAAMLPLLAQPQPHPRTSLTSEAHLSR